MQADQVIKSHPPASLSTLPLLVAITPAHNEAASIDGTIRSMLSQTLRPWCWLIVSDGSTDDTASIVAQHARRHHWIQLIALGASGRRGFDGKARAFNAGRGHLNSVPFALIANIDADITFPSDYLEFVVTRMAADPRLGVAGTIGRDEHASPRLRQTGPMGANLLDVPGAFQIFRRECLETIGGFAPVADGAIDTIATLTARMKGWRTAAFTERQFTHHRPFHGGPGLASVLRARYRCGNQAYLVGGHPVWEISRSIFYAASPPCILGGVAFAAGFLWPTLHCRSRPVSEELVKFHRREQLSRLKRPWHHLFTTGTKTSRGSATDA